MTGDSEESRGAGEAGEAGEAWEHGSMGAWEHGSMGAWEHGSMGKISSFFFLLIPELLELLNSLTPDSEAWRKPYS